ncbi:iron-sulfur cluster biosynthesis family protein [Bacillus sp. OTU530]|uniref:iron-sulfur cluster biosynthesis family protein n=1 Tax=Bacillus sp. OTU530 TaxID=3043862 RepID=UPI00313B13DD
MVITLTNVALNKLKTMGLEKGKLPRIDADVAGGCGMSIKFTLIFDGPRRGDTLIECSGIQIRIDRFTQRYLDETTKIDYTGEYGFVVGETFASSACAVEVGKMPGTSNGELLGDSKSEVGRDT